MERFFRSLKWKKIPPASAYANQVEAEADVLRYLTDYYNHGCSHSYNRYQTPVLQEAVVG